MKTKGSDKHQSVTGVSIPGRLAWTVVSCVGLSLALGSALASLEEARPDLAFQTGQAPTLKIKARTILASYKEGICCAAVSAKGLAFVAAEGSSDIEVWRVSDRKRVHVWKGHGGKIRGLGVSPSGDRVVSSSEDGTVRVWDAQGQSQPLVLKAPQAGVKAVAMSSNEKLVAGGSTEEGADAYLWELGADQEPRRLQGPGTAGGLLKKAPGALRQLEFSPDGLYLAGASGHAVILWSVASGTIETLLPNPTDNFRSASFCPNGGLLAAGGRFNATLSQDGPDRPGSVSLTDLHGLLVYLDPNKKGETHEAGTGYFLVLSAHCLPDGRHLLVVITSGTRGEYPNCVLRLIPLSSVLDGGSLRGVAEAELEPALFSVLAVAGDGSVILQKTDDKLHLWEIEVKLP